MKAPPAYRLSLRSNSTCRVLLHSCLRHCVLYIQGELTLLCFPCTGRFCLSWQVIGFLMVFSIFSYIHPWEHFPTDRPDDDVIIDPHTDDQCHESEKLKRRTEFGLGTWDSGLSITAVKVKWSCTLQRLGPQGMRNTAQTRMMLT